MVKLSFKNSVKNTLLLVATLLVLNNNVNAYTYTKNAVKFSDKEISNPYIGWFHGAVTIDLNDYRGYKYFKQEYDPDILNFRNSTISDFGVEQDSGNVSNNNEEITKIKYYDSKGNLKEIELSDKNDTLEDLNLSKEDNRKLKKNVKYNNEKYYNEKNNYSLNDQELKTYENNAIFISDEEINNIIKDSNYEKRDSIDKTLLKSADKGMYKNSRAIAKELYVLDLYDVKKVCIRQFNPSHTKIYNEKTGKTEKTSAKNDEDFIKYDTKDIEPPKLDIVLNHIKQLASIVNEYKDLIYIYQGAF
ncbi:hypothetical protein PIROE2DRAFT_6357, partial [Piromyces sp. E2]